MSHRAKIKPNKLGVPRRDAIYPTVCTPDMVDEARRQAAGAFLAMLTEQGSVPLSEPVERIYLGAKAVEVLVFLGTLPGDPHRYGDLKATAEALGDHAVLLVISVEVKA